METDQDRESVQRLYLRLAESLQRNRRDAFETPVTVAEIYQELVPYRVVRSDVGFGMNADYEHALLRLLAGEGGFARLEPTDAVTAIMKELQSPNPNVGLYRTYAGCDVWIAKPAGASAVAAESPRSTTDWSALGSLQADEPEQESVVPENAAPTPPAALSNGSSKQESETKATSQNSCVFCDSSFPANRQVRFCPFCGADQTLRPCGSCGEPLEAGWSFCIACGVTAEG